MEFTVISGTEVGQVFSADLQVATVGRDNDNFIILSGSKISRRHARLQVVDDALTVEDLGSTNGTFINDQRLPPRTPRPLRAGDRLRVGDTTLRFEGLAVPAWDSGIVAESGPSQRRRWLIPVVAVLALALLAAGVFWLLSDHDEGGTADAPVVLITPDTPTPVTFNTVVPEASTVATEGEIDQQPEPSTTGQGQPSGAQLQTTPRSEQGSAEQNQSAIVQGETAQQQGQLPDQQGQVPGGQGQLPGGQGQLPGGQGQLPGGQGQLPGGQGQLPGGQGSLPVQAGLEQLPLAAGQLFPGVSPEQLPQVIGQAALGGQLSPTQAQGLIAGMFPGVAPAQLPQAIQGAFPGVPPDQLQAVLTLVFPGQGVSVPGTSPLNGRIFYGVRTPDNRYQIYQINADGGANQLLIDDASEPAVSPDRQWLAYYSWRGDQRGLRLRRLSGANAGEDLTLTTDSNHSYPSWAPDQSRLVYYDYSSGDIQTIALDGSDSRTIATGEFPAWSPRGDRIAYKGCIGDGKCGIVLINPDGSNPTRLTTNANDGQPAWSPDGNALTFVSDRDGNWEIYAINADGTWLRRVTEQASTDGLPEWSSDGTRIAFRSDRGGSWAIWIASGVGGPATKLADAETGPNWQWEKISWR